MTITLNTRISDNGQELTDDGGVIRYYLSPGNAVDSVNHWNVFSMTPEPWTAEGRAWHGLEAAQFYALALEAERLEAPSH